MDKPAAPASVLPRWGWALGLLLAVGVVYWNSLNAPFIFDDIPAIVENPGIRRLWRPEAPLHAGTAVEGRPFLNWSFAVNYALGGVNPRGYHATNLLIHAGAGLLLWSFLRGTLRRAALPAWLRDRAEPVAWASALVWLLHPLQTEAVTCVVQRSESLAGLVYLAALAAFARATAATESHPRHWLAVSLAAVWLGMATKETVATAPLLILLYDRTFVAGSFRAAGRQRPWFYGGLALSWLLLAVLMSATGGRGGTVTLGREVTTWMSLLTQSRAIVMYLGLSGWPHPLVLDYGNFVTDTVTSLREVVPQFVLVGGLGLATLYALVRRPVLGFIGAWFFVILGPSSSFIPLLTQMRAEHRMYLVLAAVVVPAVALLWRYAGRAAPWVLGAWALALGVATVARNHDYRTELSIWTDTAEKQPGNPRVHYAVALAHEQRGETAAAEEAYHAALALRPNFVEANLALAMLWLRSGRGEAARPLLEKIQAQGAETPDNFNKLGHALAVSGEVERALAAFATAVRLDPANAEAHNNLGYYLAVQGRREEAIDHFRASVALTPGAVAYRNLGAALLQEGKTDEALAAFNAALQCEPDSAAAYYGRGVIQRRLGRTAEAREAFRQVLRIEPGHAAAARELESLGP